MRLSALEMQIMEFDASIRSTLTPGIELWNDDTNNPSRLSDMDMDSLIMIMMEYMEMDMSYVNFMEMVDLRKTDDKRGILSDKMLEDYMECPDYMATLTPVEDLVEEIMDQSNFFLYATMRLFEPSSDAEAFYTCTSKAFATTGWCTA